MKNKAHNFLVFFLIVGWTFSAPLQALETQQSTTELKSADNTEPTEADKTNPYIVVLGDFSFLPKLAVSYQYDDNIFALRDNEVDDNLLIINPSLMFTSNWKQHSVKLNLGGELGRYKRHPSEKYDDYWIDLEGRYDISKQTNLFGGLNHTRDHEERGTPSVSGTVPTTFDSDQVHAGIAHRVGDYKFRFGGTFERLNFVDAGPFNNDDRDRDVSGLGLRISYLYAPNREFFAQAIRDQRDYELDVDDNGFIRHSDGHRVSFGLKSRFSNRLSVEGYFGRLYQKYEDARFAEISTLDFNAKLKYLSSPRSSLSLVLDRSLEETTLEDSSSYLNSSLSIKALRELNSRNSVVAIFGASRADYQGVELEEDIFNASINWRYRLNPEFYVALSYRMLINDTNQSIILNNPANPQYSQDYVRQQVMLTLNAMLFDVDDPGFGKPSSRETLNLSKNDWQGFYLGTHVGHTATHVRTFGIRGSSGTDYAEFGDEGTRGGIFAGYGMDFNRWYLGVEAEIDQANQNTAHTKDKSISRTFNIEDEQSYALSLRGGYTLKSGPLLYARVGRAKAEFDTSFMINNEPGNAVNNTFDVYGIRYGIGTDISLSDSMFLRMGYIYTNYDTYIVDAVTTAEEFNQSDNVFNLGVGWLFGGNGSLANVNTNIKTNGFYAGLQLGHGSVNSRATGIHNDSGSTPGTYNFVGDFGNNSGFTSGLFAGFGHAWDSFYLGLETETEGSSAEWEHQRLPTGRDFGLKKKSGVGVGLRAGYQLRHGTLLYLTASRMRTRFITNWEKGNNSTNYIERDDKVYGNRVGFGADIPTSQSVFLRLSYSYTDYESYRFITSHGNTDDMTFNNSETLFRLGLGVRF